MATAKYDLAVARQEADERREAWLRSLGRCSCLQAGPGRSYLGERVCARCGKLGAA